MRYLDDKSRADDARLLSHAFRADGDAGGGALARQRERALGAVAVGCLLYTSPSPRDRS